MPNHISSPVYNFDLYFLLSKLDLNYLYEKVKGGNLQYKTHRRINIISTNVV